MTVPSAVPVPGAGRPARRRPRLRVAEVAEVRRPAPRWVGVVFTGAELDGFGVEAPTQHLKLLVPPAGAHHVVLPPPGPDGRPSWPDDGPRPPIRTYTPRRWDAERGRLEVELFVHGDVGDPASAPASAWASAWAARAEVGDRVAVAGPGGRVSLDLEGRRWVLLADESALPAAGTLVDAFGTGVEAIVRAEVADAGCRLPLPCPANVDVAWLDRDDDRPGSRLEEAAHEVPVDGGVQVWVAGEATSVRRVRHTLLDRGLPGHALVTRGYWRAGEQDHPDHDYGDD